MKSSSSAGPRSPAFSEFWLSATGTPWLVVSTCPRRVGAHAVEIAAGCVGSRCGGSSSPIFGEELTSLSVLLPTSTPGAP
ncbi:MAG: hypothetical protein QM749_09735 [Aquabacterium sp.]